MSVETTTAVVLDDTGTISIAQLIERSGLTEAELGALVECGALEPTDRSAATWTFTSRCLVTARTARRLRDDLALDDVHAVAIVVRLHERVTWLEHELHRFRERA